MFKRSNSKARYAALAISVSLAILVSATSACKGTSLSVPNPSQVSEGFKVPEGYYSVFEEQFTDTAVDSTIDGNQWWYRFNGTNPSWNDMSQIDRGQNRPARAQTLISRDKRNPQDYIHAEIMDTGEGRGPVLKTTVVQDDPDFQAISRFQALLQFDNDFNKLFHTFSFKIPAEMKDNLRPTQPGAPQSDWALIIEFHSIGPAQNRLGLYILHTEEHGVHFSLQLRDEEAKVNLFKDYIAPFDAWDEWVDVALQLETAGTGPQDGLIKLWLNGEQVYEKAQTFIGYPLRRLMTLKNYVGRGSMPFTIYWDDLEIYRKD